MALVARLPRAPLRITTMSAEDSSPLGPDCAGLGVLSARPQKPLLQPCLLRIENMDSALDAAPPRHCAAPPLDAATAPQSPTRLAPATPYSHAPARAGCCFRTGEPASTGPASAENLPRPSRPGRRSSRSSRAGREPGGPRAGTEHEGQGTRGPHWRGGPRRRRTPAGDRGEGGLDGVRPGRVGAGRGGQPWREGGRACWYIKTFVGIG